MFNCVLDLNEFLSLVISDARMKGYAYFYRQILSFYKSVKFLRRYSNKICREIGFAAEHVGKIVKDNKTV